jgi:chemotaxis response regulator CheB
MRCCAADRPARPLPRHHRHRAAPARDHDSLLADIFRQRLAIHVHEAADKEAVAPGTLYFAGPGYHLLVESDKTFSLSCEAPVLFSRPSIDLLMESAPTPTARAWPASC